MNRGNTIRNVIMLILSSLGIGLCSTVIEMKGLLIVGATIGFLICCNIAYSSICHLFCERDNNK